MKNINLINLKSDKCGLGSLGVGLIIGILAIVGVLAGFLAIVLIQPDVPNWPIYYNTSLDGVNQFSSYSQLSNFLNQTSGGSYGRYYGESMIKSGIGAVPGVPGASQVADSSSAGDYSQTNIQVEGVDEADIVKNDGKYIYTANGNNVVIVEAYPADEMKIVGKIDLNKSITNIFLNKDKLVLFSQDYESVPIVYSKVSEGICSEGGCGGYDYKYFTSVYIYDISDRSKPVLEKNISVEGNYLESRMIGDYVYVVSSKYVYSEQSQPPIYKVNGVEKIMPISDIYYFDYFDNSYTFNLISALKIDGDEFETKAYLMGSSGTIYVSQDNIYITSRKSVNYKDYINQMIDEVYLPLFSGPEKTKIENIKNSDKQGYEKLNEIQQIIYDYSMSLTGKDKDDFDTKLMNAQRDFNIKIQKLMDRTAIGKISIDKDKIEYVATGDVPGHILNQFSMDEYKGNFRIATTTGSVSRRGESTSLNHLYVLDEDLKVIGKVEDLAKGEKIYSARFLGDRAYMVTFKKIDPLFVIDVSNPRNPEVLGYLKITGYSDYLQPYDENHIIGIGKETRGGNENFAWYQGVKVSLFDVSDVANPVEVGKIEIGDRGTDSPALSDHKAVLFDKERNLLVVPISLALKTNNSHQYVGQDVDSQYGETVWQGAYVLNIDLNGISLKGRITHKENYTGPIYGAAHDEPIGSTRVDSQERVWTKVNITYYEYSTYSYGQWKTNASRYENLIYNDYEIDNFPGGVSYVQNQVYDYKTQIQRSLYMDDVLYTVSQTKIKANKIEDLSELNKVDLPFSETYYGYYGKEFAI